jgi:hypothetical protein
MLRLWKKFPSRFLGEMQKEVALENALLSMIPCLGKVKRPPKTPFSLVRRTFPTGSLHLEFN